MKVCKLTLIGLVAAVMTAPAMAARVHVWIGGPVWGPGYYGPPAYYYPPPVYYSPPPTVVEVPVAPPTYIERTPVQQQSTGVWYYCANPKGYYPYVQNCPGGWRPVTPTPPADPGPASPQQAPEPVPQ